MCGKLAERKIGFVATVIKGGKVTIPHEIRKLLDIKTGDLVDIIEIKNLKNSKQSNNF